jgi:cephalosporin hydroxylase
MKDNIDPKKLVDYCVNSELMHKCIFMQVYEEFLTFSYWLKGFQPNNILEIGTMGSTFWIMNKLSSGKKVSIDIENRESIIHHFMWEEDWMFVAGSSQDPNNFDKIKNKCDKYDLIFIDGDHSYDGVKNDFNLYKSLLSDRGYIAFHDIDPNHIFAGSYAGEVYKFWQDLDEGSKINLTCTKSSGKVKLNGIYSHGFGGIGLWTPN